MSKLYYLKPKFIFSASLPVNLVKYQHKIGTRKWLWLTEHLCGRNSGSEYMFPAAVPWCELAGETYDDQTQPR